MIEIWVLYQPDQVSKRIGHRGNLNPSANILDRGRNNRANTCEMLDGGFYLLNTPIGNATAGPRLAQPEIRIEPKFVPSDIETDVERLVEVRFLLECLRIPRRRAMQIRDVINNGAESTNPHRSPNRRRVEASLFGAGSRLIRSSINGKHQYHRDGYQTQRERSAEIVHYAQHATAACCRKCIEYWHGIGPVREMEKAMEMKEAS